LKKKFPSTKLPLVILGALFGVAFLPLLSFSQEVGSAETAQPRPTLQQTITKHNLVVPADTVLFISIASPLSSNKSQIGEIVHAVVLEAIYLGPYLVIPKGAVLEGKVTHVNAHKDDEGRHPYIVAEFTKLKPDTSSESLTMHALLIAYKTGIIAHEYDRQLPQNGSNAGSVIKSVISGAISGAMFNPLFGAPLGAGTGLVQSLVVNKFAQGGSVHIKAEKPFPIALDQPLVVSVPEPPPENGPKDTMKNPPVEEASQKQPDL
jgi:hypothetical protein